MIAPAVIHDLRMQLAGALCAAQSLPVPRSLFAQMLRRLLHHAFESLDDDSGVERHVAVRVAAHAVAAWQAAVRVALPAAPVAAVGG